MRKDSITEPELSRGRPGPLELVQGHHVEARELGIDAGEDGVGMEGGGDGRRRVRAAPRAPAQEPCKRPASTPSPGCPRAAVPALIWGALLRWCRGAWGDGKGEGGKAGKGGGGGGGGRVLLKGPRGCGRGGTRLTRERRLEWDPASLLNTATNELQEIMAAPYRGRSITLIKR